MSTIRFKYTFIFEGGRREVFDIRLDEDSQASVSDREGDLPRWTRLDCQQCPNCPLTVQSHPHCPVAVQLVPLVSGVADVTSYEVVQVAVQSSERVVTQRVKAQDAVSSLMGVLMATSACPHMRFLRPMARFHLPLASGDETVYRAASMFLLGQYFRHRQGEPAELSLTDLRKSYETLRVVNVALARRLREAIDRDAAVNAVIVLDLLAQHSTLELEERLEAVRVWFDA